MGDQEIEMEVSYDFEEENSSQVSQTVSNMNNKKNVHDDHGRGGKNSEIGIGKKKNLMKQNAQKSQKEEQLSNRELRKIQQSIAISENQSQKQTDKGRKKAQKQQGNKTPRSDSSIETEQNPKSNKTQSGFQNTTASTNSSAVKANGQPTTNQISIFQQHQQLQQMHQQQMQQQQQQQQQQQSVQGNGIEQSGNSNSGLARIINASTQQIDYANIYNGNIQNQHDFQNMQTPPPPSQQQNGSHYIQQQIQHFQSQQPFTTPKINTQQQQNIINNSINHSQVIVTEDDSEISASCDNLDDKSNATSNIISNINPQYSNMNSNNLNGTNSSGQNASSSSGTQQGKRKRTLRKHKDNIPLPQQQSQPPLPDMGQNSTNIEVISTEGKISTKQGSSRSTQNICSNSNSLNNLTSAVVSIIPRKQSSQTNTLIQTATTDINNIKQLDINNIKQLDIIGSNGKTILLQNNPNNSNIIQLQRKIIEEANLISQQAVIPNTQLTSNQNLEEIQNRQIEQQQSTQNITFAQQTQQAGSIQSIQIKNPGIQNQNNIPQQNLGGNNLINNHSSTSQHHHHQIVNPSALPHALPPTHNMINIPSQPQQPIQNTNNSNNQNSQNTNDSNQLNPPSTSANTSQNTNNNTNANTNSSSTNISNVNYSESQISSQTALQADQTKTKKKKRQKNLAKAEAHALQQQQMIGQVQQQSNSIQQQTPTPSQQKAQNNTTQQDMQEEMLLSNQNSNMFGQQVQQQQSNNLLQQGLVSPTSNSNTFTQNMLSNFSNNGSLLATANQVKPETNADQEENEFKLPDIQKIGSQPPILGISNSQQLIREQSNQKQAFQAKQLKPNRKNDQEYKQRMKKGPLNQSAFEDQPALFLRLSDYQEQQKKEREEAIEKHLEDLNESTHSQNGQNGIQQFNTSSLFLLSNSTNSFLGNTISTSSSTKPLLSFKINNLSKQEQDKLEINSQDNDSQANGVNKTPVVTSNGSQIPSQIKSRIKKLDSQTILDKTLIIQDKITKKFKNSHYPESFKEAFSGLHTDFASTYLDPSYCSKLVTFFNRQQEFNKIGDKEDTEIDY